jgi:selenocysteine lyase/cysteine desulfurase
MDYTSTSRRGFLKALTAAGVAAPLLARAEQLEAAVDAPLWRQSFDASSAASMRMLMEQYLLSGDLTYLNHASIGTIPISVHSAHVAYLELCESHPSLYMWGAVWREVTEDTRRAAATLLGAEADDIAITHNTTEGFNILAHGLPLRRGDEVLFSSLNHGGASVALAGLGRAGGIHGTPLRLPRGASPRIDRGRGRRSARGADPVEH